MLSSNVFFASFIALAASVSVPQLGSLVQVEQASRVPPTFSLVGPASASSVIKLRVALPSQNQDGLTEELYAISTPGSPKYGQHLTKEQLLAYTAPTAESVSSVKAWLASAGLTVQSTSFTGEWLSVEVPVSTANAMLGPDYQTYTHLVSGKQIMRTLSYSIPSSLVGHVEAIYPTTSFDPPTTLSPKVSSITQGKRAPLDARSSDCSTSIVPTCLQSMYNIPTTAKSAPNNTLGVAGYSNQFASKVDLELFLKQYPTEVSPSTTFSVKSIDGGVNLPVPAGDEADLDIQYTVGLAYGVPITFYTVGSANTDGLDGFIDATNAVMGSTTKVFTTSYGFNEGDVSVSLANTLCNSYKALSAAGISVLYASGDGGVSGSQSAACTTFVPTFPSGCPYVTSVGATQGLTETAASFSSGGFSNYFPQADFQASAVQSYLGTLGSTYSGLYNASGRGFPDVSTQGVNFTIVYNLLSATVDGTSCASPTFASIISLINGERINVGKPSLGWLNPFLYQNAAVLNDITTGSNPGCSTNGFSAASGWDPVTGLGTPNYPKLLAAALSS